MRARPLLIVLLLVLVLGAGAYLAFAPGDAPPPPQPVAEKSAARAVMAMQSAVPPGHILRPEDLRRVPWPADPLPPAAIVDGTPEAEKLAGSVTRRAFSAGEVIVRDQTVAPGERGFLAAIVTPGYRAVALRVDAQSSASGLIWPGDRVDIILTQELRQDGVPLTQSVVGETVMRDVRVLSSDQRLETAVPQGAAATEEAAAPQRPGIPATVTVEVLPRDAERLAVASTLGRISLVLRSVTDSPEMLSDAPTYAGEVSRGLRELRARPADVQQPPQAPAQVAAIDVPRVVRIYRGSAGNQ